MGSPATSAEEFLAALPPELRETRYVYDRYPGAPDVIGVATGANCQQYAYEILRLVGYEMPPLRSRELHDDTTATTVVPDIEQATRFDLVLFSAVHDAVGAHVGVYLGDGQVLHLCYRVGRPAIWPLTRFASDPKYRNIVGIKRPVRTTTRCGYG